MDRPNFVLLLLLAGITLITGACYAQPKSGLRLPPPLNLVEAEQKGRALVADLLAQRPQESSTNRGTMKIETSDGKERDVPIRFEVISKPGDWLNTYEAAPVGSAPGEKLSILHHDAKPNEYSVSMITGAHGSPGAARKLTVEQTMVPFAGSDFWIADLGLEFLHWPQQLLLKQEMRRSRSCNVLASTNPHPVLGAYSCVVTWFDIESGGVVQAQALDAQGKPLKEFAPKEMKKVQGQWQLEEMMIRNLQTDSTTRVQFDLDR